MSNKYKLALSLLIAVGAVVVVMLFLRSGNIPVLDPKGMIAMKERGLMVRSILLMLIVVIPVFIMTFVIAWKYRASNTKAKYTPDWDHHHVAEWIWWGLPCVIVVGLAFMAWKSSYELDPFKPLESSREPIKIQVVALQWKWLFIYPEHQIATVNFVQFPEKTPVNFEITADAPMNSFWIPQLGGQIYAMPGMITKLHLIADVAGRFRGSSANLSGVGFSKMTFMAQAGTQADFDEWVKAVKQSPQVLGENAYHLLAEPGVDYPIKSYVVQKEDLFEQIVMKYMRP